MWFYKKNHGKKWGQNLFFVDIVSYLEEDSFLLGGLRGGVQSSRVGKPKRATPQTSPKWVGALFGKVDLGAAAGTIPMRTTFVRGTPGICDSRFPWCYYFSLQHSFHEGN